MVVAADVAATEVLATVAANKHIFFKADHLVSLSLFYFSFHTHIF